MTKKALILDLGGVIMDIDYNESLIMFEKMGASSFGKIYEQSQQTDLFDKFEEGKITEPVFRLILAETLNLPMSAKELDHAWNAMLIGFTLDKLKLVQELSKEYALFLYSNINTIHYRKVIQIMQRDLGKHDIFSYFEKCYFSHLFGHRKPKQVAFNALCRDIKEKYGFEKSQLLFIDDTIRHIEEGAKKVGINALHVQSNLSASELKSIIDEEIIYSSRGGFRY